MSTIDPALDVRLWPAVQFEIGAMRRLRFQHLATSSIRWAHHPPSINATAKGRSVWECCSNEPRVGIQWHWWVGPDGVVMLDNVLSIETNVLVVNCRHQVIGARPPALECLFVLDALNWQAEVVKALAAAGWPGSA